MIRRSALLLSAFTMLSACDTSLADERFGAIEVSTTAPTVEGPVSTADGWSIEYDRFLVHISALNVAGADQVLTASAAGLIVDQASPPPKVLLASTVRRARLWEDVNFQIGPASEGDVVLVGSATPADAELLQSEGLSIHVEGTARRGSERLTFRWGFSSDTTFTACEGGLEVPLDGTGTAEITMRGDVLFADDLAEGATLRFQPFANADADGDGSITLDELHDVTLEAARSEGGPYASEAADLGAFVEEQTRRIVAAYRGTGRCMAEATPAATE